MPRILKLTVGVLLGACAHGGGMRDCTATPLAIVSNNWGREIDIYAELDRGANLVLGQVSPGERREFTLPAGTTRLTYRWRGPYAGPPPTSADVPIHFVCR